jgi:hypothetical protein
LEKWEFQGAQEFRVVSGLRRVEMYENKQTRNSRTLTIVYDFKNNSKKYLWSCCGLDKPILDHVCKFSKEGIFSNIEKPN